MIKGYVIIDIGRIRDVKALKGDKMKKVRYEMQGDVMDLIIDEMIKEVCSVDGIEILFTDQMIRDNVDPCYKEDRTVAIYDIMGMVDRVSKNVTNMIFKAYCEYCIGYHDNVVKVIMNDVYYPVFIYKDGK